MSDMCKTLNPGIFMISLKSWHDEVFVLKKSQSFISKKIVPGSFEFIES